MISCVFICYVKLDASTEASDAGKQTGRRSNKLQNLSSRPQSANRGRSGGACFPVRADRKTALTERNFAAAERPAINSAKQPDSPMPKSQHKGVQFATIPEFQSIGVTVGQQMSAALAGKETVDAALKASQLAADREMKKAGYYK